LAVTTRRGWCKSGIKHESEELFIECDDSTAAVHDERKDADNTGNEPEMNAKRKQDGDLVMASLSGADQVCKRLTSLTITLSRLTGTLILSSRR
jgi:hypothetical protein